MQLSFDPIVCGLVLVAFFLALHEYRRNTRVILKIIDASALMSRSVDKYNGKWYHKLVFTIRNQGRTLHSLSVFLEFSGPNKSGWITCPLHRRSTTHSDHTQFPPGMVGVFSFESPEIDQGQRGMLLLLSDVRAQDAVLSVYSNGYLAKSFRIGRAGDKAKLIWNRLAWRFNSAFDTHIQRPSQRPLTKLGEVLPYAHPLHVKVNSFLANLKKEAEAVGPDTTRPSNAPS